MAHLPSATKNLPYINNVLVIADSVDHLNLEELLPFWGNRLEEDIFWSFTGKISPESTATYKIISLNSWVSEIDLS